MTDQQAPECPYGHGPMVWTDNISAGEIVSLPIPPGWWCHADDCNEYATPALLKQEHQRGRSAKEAEFRRNFSLVWARDAQFNWFYINHGGAFTPMSNPINEAVDAQRQRAEQAEARAQELEAERDRLRGGLQIIKRDADRTAKFCGEGRHIVEMLGTIANNILANTCPRCGNPQPDCQCRGSKEMEGDHPMIRTCAHCGEPANYRAVCGVRTAWFCRDHGRMAEGPVAGYLYLSEDRRILAMGQNTLSLYPPHLQVPATAAQMEAAARGEITRA